MHEFYLFDTKLRSCRIQCLHQPYEQSVDFLLSADQRWCGHDRITNGSNHQAILNCCVTTKGRALPIGSKCFTGTLVANQFKRGQHARRSYFADNGVFGQLETAGLKIRSNRCRYRVDDVFARQDIQRRDSGCASGRVSGVCEAMCELATTCRKNVCNLVANCYATQWLIAVGNSFCESN